MKKQLFIHIGPYKTGTTSVQEHFWRNRTAYVKKGVLYPRTGIFSDFWGHRHLRLANTFRHDLWKRLVREIEKSKATKILVSSERLSYGLTHLAEARHLIEAYDPHLIVVLRDEADLLHSLYLQTVKSYFTEFRGRRGPGDFQTWLASRQTKFIYARMIRQWVDIFGPDRMTFIVYPRSKRLDIVEEICAEMGVPVLKRFRQSNPSIGTFAARLALLGERVNWKFGRLMMRVGRKIERRFPKLAKAKVPGFDAAELRAFYDERNRAAVKAFPGFGAKYREIQASRAPKDRP